jgi:hypothetical protein
MLSLESKSDREAGITEVSQRLVALIFLWHHHDISWGFYVFIRFHLVVPVLVVPTKMLQATEDRELLRVPLTAAQSPPTRNAETSFAIRVGSLNNRAAQFPVPATQALGSWNRYSVQRRESGVLKRFAATIDARRPGTLAPYGVLVGPRRDPFSFTSYTANTRRFLHRAV